MMLTLSPASWFPPSMHKTAAFMEPIPRSKDSGIPLQAISLHDRVAYLGFAVAAPGTVGRSHASAQQS